MISLVKGGLKKGVQMNSSAKQRVTGVENKLLVTMSQVGGKG